MLNLLAKLGLDISPFQRGLNAAQTSGKRFSDTLARDVGPSIKEAMFGALSAGAVVGFGRQILDYAGKINDLSDQFGIAREEIQGLMAAAEDSGIEFERLGGALDKIGNSRRDAAEGNAKLRAEFERFGVSLADLNDPAKSNLDLLKAIGGSLATMTPTAAIRESFGELVGEKGQRLMEVIKGLQDLKPVSILSDAEVKTLDDFGDRVGSITRELKNLAGRTLADAINQADAASKEAGGGLAGGFAGLLKAADAIIAAPFKAALGVGAFSAEGATGPLTAEDIAAAREGRAGAPLFTEPADAKKASAAGAPRGLPTFDPRIAAGGLASAGLFFGGAGNPLLREAKTQTDLTRQSVTELKRLVSAVREEL